MERQAGHTGKCRIAGRGRRHFDPQYPPLPAGDDASVGCRDADPPPASTIRTHEWIQVFSDGVVVDLRRVPIDPPGLLDPRQAITVPVTFGDNIAASKPLLAVSGDQVRGGGHRRPVMNLMNRPDLIRRKTSSPRASPKQQTL